MSERPNWLPEHAVKPEVNPEAHEDFWQGVATGGVDLSGERLDLALKLFQEHKQSQTSDEG